MSIAKASASVAKASASTKAAASIAKTLPNTRLLRDLRNPPREFSPMPFWFWNDNLRESEILRQIADFDAHGVYGFVIHPRVGLPRSIGWMSDAMLDFMEAAIEEASARDMKVILYDEGMYPSGSSSGQVVAADPSLACRCLAILPEGAELPEGSSIVARPMRLNGEQITIIDRKADSVIRGLHYHNEVTASEDLPQAGDILNPRTADMVLKLVHDKFYARFQRHFGKTVIGIFTDEPHPLGRVREPGVMPGTTGIIPRISELLGYDFAPHLPALWFADEPDAHQHRSNFARAIAQSLEQTWYQPLSNWCASHGVALCGHPDRGDDIGTQRHFHIPGQDLVWRWVTPDHPSALEGPESTQGKCTSSAMVHQNAKRNSNELCGAYGRHTTFEEFKWLGDWCMIRGVNMLIPHAFYYSIRGPRRNERPPQVGGVGCTWWHQFKPLAEHWRRLSWLNTDSTPVVRTAIYAPNGRCPWRAAKACFEHQRDFNYVDAPALMTGAVDGLGIQIGDMHYDVLILDSEIELSANEKQTMAPLAKSGRVLAYGNAATIDAATPIPTDAALIETIDRLTAPDLALDTPVPSLRIRHLIKDGEHFYLFFNESQQPIATKVHLSVEGAALWIDTATAALEPTDRAPKLELPAYGFGLLWIATSGAEAINDISV